MIEVTSRRAVTDPAQVRLLGSPVRQEIVDTIAALGGQASVSALAEQLGRPADGLYYHLRALVRGGLLGETASPGAGECGYRLLGDDCAPLRLVYDLGPGGNKPEVRAFVRALLQVTGRDFEQALDTPGVAVGGPRRALWASRNKGWLSPEDMAEAVRLLERISALMSQPKAPGRDHLASCAFVLAPLNPRPKRRGVAPAATRGAK
jgi:DNA-binding transcriptional ArsR family regulator